MSHITPSYFRPSQNKREIIMFSHFSLPHGEPTSHSLPETFPMIFHTNRTHINTTLTSAQRRDLDLSILNIPLSFLERINKTIMRGYQPIIAYLKLLSFLQRTHPNEFRTISLRSLHHDLTMKLLQQLISLILINQ